MYKKKVYSYIPTATTWGFPGGIVAKIPWRRKWQPLKYSYLDRGAWQATGHGVASNPTAGHTH